MRVVPWVSWATVVALSEEACHFWLNCLRTQGFGSREVGVWLHFGDETSETYLARVRTVDSRKEL